MVSPLIKVIGIGRNKISYMGTLLDYRVIISESLGMVSKENKE